MDAKMFCFQCQETAGGKGCTVAGVCGKKPEVKIALGVKKWTCLYCGTLHQRDDNAAKNLLSLAVKHHVICKTLDSHIVLVRKDGLLVE